MHSQDFCKFWRQEADHIHWGLSDKVFWRTAGEELFATNQTIASWTGCGLATVTRWRQWAVNAGMLTWSGDYIDLDTGKRTDARPKKWIKVYRWSIKTNQNKTNQSDDHIGERYNRGTFTKTNQVDESKISRNGCSPDASGCSASAMQPSETTLPTPGARQGNDPKLRYAQPDHPSSLTDFFASADDLENEPCGGCYHCHSNQPQHCRYKH